MSSTPKRFTRYDAEHHDLATEYVLASEHDAAIAQARRETDLACDSLGHATESNAALRCELEAAKAQLVALSYPVHLHTHTLLTVESGGIRYVLEVLDDEDGDWFEVKSATPLEAMDIEAFASNADHWTQTERDARTALAAHRAAQREDDEASQAY